jgi:hypothetical protein
MFTSLKLKKILIAFFKAQRHIWLCKEAIYFTRGRQSCSQTLKQYQLMEVNMNRVASIKNLVKRGFKLSLYAGIFSVSLLNIGSMNQLAACSHCEHAQEANLELGVRLETEFWTLVQQKGDFAEKLSRIFQGLNAKGPYTRENQIVGLQKANLLGFTINNPVVTRHQDTLVITYYLAAVGTGIVSGPDITVWKKHNHEWKIISHSYF